MPFLEVIGAAITVAETIHGVVRKEQEKAAIDQLIDSVEQISQDISALTDLGWNILSEVRGIEQQINEAFLGDIVAHARVAYDAMQRYRDDPTPEARETALSESIYALSRAVSFGGSGEAAGAIVYATSVRLRIIEELFDGATSDDGFRDELNAASAALMSAVQALGAEANAHHRDPAQLGLLDLRQIALDYAFYASGQDIELDDNNNSIYVPYYVESPTVIDGYGGNDNLASSGGDDAVRGGSGNDTLFGGAGDDQLRGGDGDDFLYVDGGNNLLNGDAGFDTALFFGAGTASLTVSLARTDYQQFFSGSGLNRLLTIEGLQSGDGSDSLTGNGGANRIEGRGGNDTILGGADRDTLVGGDGNDAVQGQDGDDTLIGGAGDDLFDGGADFDTVSYADAVAGVSLSLLTTASQATGEGNDAFVAVEAIQGSAFGDDVTGSDVANRLDTGAGDDTVSGAGGSDTIFGGAGADMVDAGEGDDLLYGDSTDDSIADTGDTLVGGGGNDVFERVSSSPGGLDTLAGGTGRDTYMLRFVAGDTADRVTDFTTRAGGDVLNLTAHFGALDAGDGFEGGIFRFVQRGANVLLQRDVDPGAGQSYETMLVFDDVNVDDFVVSNFDVGVGFAQRGWNRYGTSGNDNMSVAAALQGDDTLNGGLGADTMAGGFGNDTYLVDDSGDRVIELNGQGDDLVRSSVTFSLGGLYAEDLLLTGNGDIDAAGNSLANTLTGNSGDNKLSGGGNADTIIGGEGNDTLAGGLGADSLVGGGGIDAARYDEAAYGDLVINLTNPGLNTGAAAGDTYVGIEGVIGGAGNDSIAGNAARNFLFGSAGNDSLFGGAGNDVLTGGDGGDSLYGGIGADQHIGSDGPGIDYARYDDADYGNLTIRMNQPELSTGAAAGDTFEGIEGIYGGLGNDTIWGNGARNYLQGGGGVDGLRGGGGNDYLNGGDGGDALYGGAGADQHVGGDGAGVDYARYDDANHGDLVINLTDASLNTGAAAGDSYVGIEGIVGGFGADIITGNGARNYLYGGGGDDVIDGSGGNDVLAGQGGADDFRFSTALNATNIDTINGFEHGVDDIALSQAIFAGIGATLDAGEFGSAAGGGTVIIYDQATGRLFFDAGGSGSGPGPMAFATVAVGTVLDINDFVMVA